MTKADYIQAIQDQVDDTSARAEKVIKRAFNGAYRQILQRVGRFMLQEESSTETALTGTDTLTPVNKFTTIIELFIQNGSGYSQIQATTQFTPTHEVGIPTRYYVKGDTIFFDKKFPTATNVKLRWTPRPTSLGDGDTVLLDDSYEYVLINGAVARFFQYEGDAGYQDYGMQFQEDLRELALDYSTRQPVVTPSL